MSLSIAAHEFKKALDEGTLEQLVLGRLSLPREHADTGSRILDECLDAAMAFSYRLEFPDASRERMLSATADGAPLQFRAIPEYDARSYLLAKECEQLTRQYIAAWNTLHADIGDLLRSIDNAQAAQERVRGELARPATNGNGHNIAEKTKREAKEADLKSKDVQYAKQIEGWERKKTAAEQELRELKQGGPAQRLTSVAGALQPRMPHAPRFVSELAHYHIAPAAASGKVFCDVPENVRLPGEITDVLNVIAPVQDGKPQVGRRSAMTALGLAALGLTGLVTGGAYLFGRKRELRQDEDYFFNVLSSGCAPSATFRNGETWEGYQIKLNPVVSDPKAVPKAVDLILTGDNSLIEIYKAQLHSPFRIRLKGKEHLVNVWQQHESDGSGEYVFSPQCKTFSLQFRSSLAQQQAFETPFITEVHQMPRPVPEPLPFNIAPVYDSAQGLFLASFDERNPPKEITYALYRITDEKARDAIKKNQHYIYGDVLKLPREIICSGTYKVPPLVQIPSNQFPLANPFR